MCEVKVLDLDWKGGNRIQRDEVAERVEKERPLK